MEITAQIIGIVAIIVSILSMTFKSKKMIMLLCTIYNIMTLTSYLFLGKYLGSILVGILTLKSFIYYIYALKKAKPNLVVLIILEIAILTMSIVLWQFWFDIFILLSSLINTYFSWQDNVKILKISVVITSVLLVLYDIFAGAYVYVISEILYGGTALISLLFVKRGTKDNEQNVNTGEREENL